jgi:hypothetical protein
MQEILNIAKDIGMPSVLIVIFFATLPLTKGIWTVYLERRKKEENKYKIIEEALRLDKSIQNYEGIVECKISSAYSGKTVRCDAILFCLSHMNSIFVLEKYISAKESYVRYIPEENRIQFKGKLAESKQRRLWRTCFFLGYFFSALLGSACWVISYKLGLTPSSIAITTVLFLAGIMFFMSSIACLVAPDALRNAELLMKELYGKEPQA